MLKRAKVVVAMLAVACSKDATCLALPCPMSVAVQLTVTSAASGSAVPGGVIKVTGVAQGTFTCDGTCSIPGTEGDYELDISAPGFGPVHRSVVVHGTTPSCGCPSTELQQVTIALTPTA